MRNLFAFPNPVNEKAARVVAAGVVLVGTAFLATTSPWVLAALAYGFWARVLAGPRLSPLGQFATRIVAPHLGDARLVAGPPKRFAQAVGVAFSSTALVAYFTVGAGVAQVIIGLLVVAAALEAFLGLCLGCKAFGFLMKAGIVPDSVCLECADISRRYPQPAR